jgi:23S rRNA (guanosine2251-2'-O)-methyltransferase
VPRIVYGVHPVDEVLRRRGADVQALLVSRRQRVDHLVAAAEQRHVAVQLGAPEDLDALSGGRPHQGVVAVVGEYPYVDLEDLLANLAQVSLQANIDHNDYAVHLPNLSNCGNNDLPSESSIESEPSKAANRISALAGPAPELSAGVPLLVVLDSVTDPQNLGAIMRSALVLGATGVVLPKDRAAPVTPTVVRVSAGASEHLPCARVTNLARALEQMKAAGVWTVGAVESGGVLPEQADLAAPVAIVLGNEQKGIRPLVRRGCDVLLTIPSRGAIASLNVSAAATALLYEAARQRRGVCS